MPTLIQRLFSRFLPPPSPAERLLAETRERKQLAEAKAEAAYVSVLDQLTESLEEYGQIVNPLERWADDVRDGFRPYQGGAGFDRRKDGRDPDVIWNEQDLGTERRSSRQLWTWNDFAGGAGKRLVEYTVGAGFSWTVCQKGVDKGPPSLGDEDGTPQIVKQAQACLDHFRDLDKWLSRELENVRRIHRDGEVFLRLFRGADGQVPKCRVVNPEYIRTPEGGVTNGVFGFGIFTHPDDIEQPLAYYVADPRDPSKGRIVLDASVDFGSAGYDRDEVIGMLDDEGFGHFEVGAGVILHLKWNADRDIKRGHPTFLATKGGFESSRKLVRNIMNTAAVQASIAMIRKHNGGTQSTITNFASQAAQARIPAPGLGSTGGYQINQVPVQWQQPGAVVFDTNENLNYDPGPVSTGTPNFLQGHQAQLRAAGVREALPEYTISGDASNNNFASIKEAGSPFVVARSSDQNILCDFERDVALNVLRLCSESGAISGDVSCLGVEVKAPPVSIRSDLEQAQIQAVKIQNKTLSPVEAIQQDGRDPKHTIAGLKAWSEQVPNEQGANLPMPGDLFGGGDGGSTGNPREGRLAEVTDDSGHKHGNDGKFSSSDGGGSSKPADKKPADHKPAGTDDDPIALVPFTEEPGTAAGRAVKRIKDVGSVALDTKVGRLVLAAEHKLSIVAHKTRDVAEAALNERGFTPEQAASFKRKLAIADFLGGFATSGAVAATGNLLAAKGVGFLPSVSALYVAYSTVAHPASTWAAARKVAMATVSNKAHEAIGDPDFANRLADLYESTTTDVAEWRVAVLFAALAQGAGLDEAFAAAKNAGDPQTATPTPADFGEDDK